MSFFSKLFNKINTSCREGNAANKYKGDIAPVMLYLDYEPMQKIKQRYCYISKVGIISDIAYIYDGLGKKWYKVNLLNNSVEEVATIENIEKWEYKTVNKETILWQLANTVGICAMMWSGSSKFQIDDVFTSITTQINNSINKYNVVVNLCRYNWITKYKNKQISMEELVRMIPLDATSDKNSNQIIHMDENWTLVKDIMKQSYEPNTIPIVPEGTANFTSTIYVCPTCEKFITKVLLQETYINVDGNKKEIDKTFSCKYCDSFYAPVIGHYLNEGAFYYLKVSSDRYKEVVQRMDRSSRNGY